MDKQQKSEYDIELNRAKADRLANLMSRKKSDRHRIYIPAEGGFLKQQGIPKPLKTDKERIAELEAQVAELTKKLGG